MKRWITLAAGKMIDLPFIGKFLALAMFGGPFASAAILIWVPPWAPEQSAEGRILRVETLNPGFANKVEYEFEAGGRTITGTMRYVELTEHPEIREGAAIRVYYHPAWNAISRAEGQSSVAEILWFGILAPWGLWVVAALWGWRLHRKWRPVL